MTRTTIKLLLFALGPMTMMLTRAAVIDPSTQAPQNANFAPPQPALQPPPPGPSQMPQPQPPPGSFPPQQPQALDQFKQGVKDDLSYVARNTFRDVLFGPSYHMPPPPVIPGSTMPPPGPFGAMGQSVPGQYGSMPPSSYGSMPPSSYGSMPPSSYGSMPPNSYGSMPPSSYGSAPPQPYGSMSPQTYGTTPPSPYGSMPQHPQMAGQYGMVPPTQLMAPYSAATTYSTVNSTHMPPYGTSSSWFSSDPSGYNGYYNSTPYATTNCSGMIPPYRRHYPDFSLGLF